MLENEYKVFEEKLKKSVDFFKSSLVKIRTGKASLGIFDGIKVSHYGNPTPLKNVANLATPEPRLITIQPWETNMIPEIEKAILKSDLGLTPQVDGKIIRLSIPPLNEQRRKELVKMVSKMAEENKVSLRNIRRETNDVIKKMQADKVITEDGLHKATAHIQTVLDKYIKQIDELFSHKEKEIMEI